MIRRRPLPIVLLAIFCMSAAFALRGAIHAFVIVPLAYLWWVINLYYHWVPQAVIWALLVFAVLYIIVRGLLLEIPVRKFIRVERPKPKGAVEALSELVRKGEKGIYHKWLVANRLGKAARELINQREGRSGIRRLHLLKSRDWNPPQDVGEYLESGLNGSFADYPRAGWMRPKHTPLDMNPGKALDYLEAEMENSRNGNR